MKLTISPERFKEIIHEEVKNYQKIKQLEKDKKTLEEALIKLNEAESQEEIDELWGGLKNIFKTGAQNAANSVANTYQNTKNKVSQNLSNAGQAIQQQAQKVKQVYQQGEKEQAIKNVKSEINNLWKKRKEIQDQLQNMQNKYMQLTGKKLGNQFTSKNPQTVAPQQPVQNKPQQAAE